MAVTHGEVVLGTSIYRVLFRQKGELVMLGCALESAVLVYLRLCLTRYGSVSRFGVDYQTDVWPNQTKPHLLQLGEAVGKAVGEPSTNLMGVAVRPHADSWSQPHSAPVRYSVPRAASSSILEGKSCIQNVHRTRSFLLGCTRMTHRPRSHCTSMSLAACSGASCLANARRYS